MKELTSNL